MKLYTSPGACSTADHIVLEWIGKPYTFEIVTREQRATPEFKKLNPAGAVPVLDDGGWILTQNAAIMNYLVDLHPESGLGGDGTPKSRAEVNRWLSFVNADLHPQYYPIFGSTRYLEDEAVIARTQQNSRDKLKGLYQRLNDRLAQVDWLGGTPRPSIADAYTYVTLRWARGLKIDLAGMDALDRFEQRMQADPAVQAALKAEGLG